VRQQLYAYRRQAEISLNAYYPKGKPVQPTLMTDNFSGPSTTVGDYVGVSGFQTITFE